MLNYYLNLAYAINEKKDHPGKHPGVKDKPKPAQDPGRVNSRGQKVPKTGPGSGKSEAERTAQLIKQAKRGASRLASGKAARDRVTAKVSDAQRHVIFGRGSMMAKPGKGVAQPSPKGKYKGPGDTVPKKGQPGYTHKKGDPIEGSDDWFLRRGVKKKMKNEGSTFNYYLSLASMLTEKQDRGDGLPRRIGHGTDKVKFKEDLRAKMKARIDKKAKTKVDQADTDTLAAQMTGKHITRIRMERGTRDAAKATKERKALNAPRTPPRAPFASEEPRLTTAKPGTAGIKTPHDLLRLLMRGRPTSRPPGTGKQPRTMGQAPIERLK